MQSRQLLTGVRNLKLRPSGTSTLFADFYTHFAVVTGVFFCRIVDITICGVRHLMLNIYQRFEVFATE